MKRKKHNISTNIWNKSSLCSLLFFIISALFFVFIYSNSYRYSKPIDIESLPLIKKADQEIKIQPANAAGLVISHQDKVIYERMKGQDTAIDDKIPQAISKYKNADEELSLLRAKHLMQKADECQEGVFDMIGSEFDVILSFGLTGTREAAETKQYRIAKQYSELQNQQFKIAQIPKSKFKLQLENAISSAVANNICNKMKKVGEECNVEH